MTQHNTLTIQTADTVIKVAPLGAIGLLAWNDLEWQLLEADGDAAIFRTRGFRVTEDENAPDGWRPAQDIEICLDGSVTEHQRGMLMGYKPLTLEEAWQGWPGARVVEYEPMAA